jgi:plastocyanin
VHNLISSALAATHNVDVHDFAFTPATITASVGDNIVYVAASSIDDISELNDFFFLGSQTLKELIR